MTVSAVATVADYRQTVVVAAPEPPLPLSLSPGREALAVANAAVKAAQQAFDEADKPVAALQAVVARAQQAEATLAELQAERQRRVGDWLVSGAFGERPAISHIELKAEKAVKTARSDADAAEKALPAVLGPRNAALAALNAAVAQRAHALVCAALDAAREVVEAELVPAIEGVLLVERRLLGLRHALFLAANRASGAIPAAGGAVGAIVDMIRAAKNEVGIQQDNAGGEAFLNALGADPQAKL
jgi:hypothetical protein